MQSEKAIGNGYHLQLMNGVLFVILFASAAYQLSQWHYISLLGISPLIVGIVLGMIYGNTLRLHLPVYWLPGILFSSKVLLRVAIVLYGFRLTFQDLLLVGFNGLAISSIMLTSTFIGGTWLGIKASACPPPCLAHRRRELRLRGPPPYFATEPVVKANPTKAASPWARSWFSAPSPCSSIPSCTATASST
ncbi:MAG: putative sulfate exporter family transporter [Bilophila wadsworthia]